MPMANHYECKRQASWQPIHTCMKQCLRSQRNIIHKQEAEPGNQSLRTANTRSQAPPGNALSSRLRLAPRSSQTQPTVSAPVRTNFNHPFLTSVASSTRVPPMDRIIDIPATKWIVVNVLELLPHDPIAFNDLRMAAFLPNLMCLVNFVPLLVVFQFLKQCPIAHLPHLLDHRCRCKRFELTNSLT